MKKLQVFLLMVLISGLSFATSEEVAINCDKKDKANTALFTIDGCNKIISLTKIDNQFPGFRNIYTEGPLYPRIFRLQKGVHSFELNDITNNRLYIISFNLIENKTYSVLYNDLTISVTDDSNNPTNFEITEIPLYKDPPNDTPYAELFANKKTQMNAFFPIRRIDGMTGTEYQRYNKWESYVRNLASSYSIRLTPGEHVIQLLVDGNVKSNGTINYTYNFEENKRYYFTIQYDKKGNPSLQLEIESQAENNK